MHDSRPDTGLGFWLGVALLLAVPVAPAALSGLFHPRAPDWAGMAVELRAVTVTAADSLKNVIWVDAREPGAFEAGHVPGAINLGESDWEAMLPDLIDAWSPGRKIIVYCDGDDCLASRQVALRIRRELALDDVVVLTGGWPAWSRAHADAGAGEDAR